MYNQIINMRSIWSSKGRRKKSLKELILITIQLLQLLEGSDTGNYLISERNANSLHNIVKL